MFWDAAGLDVTIDFMVLDKPEGSVKLKVPFRPWYLLRSEVWITRTDLVILSMTKNGATIGYPSIMNPMTFMRVETIQLIRLGGMYR